MGGSSSNSNTANWPDYMKNRHDRWLGEIADLIAVAKAKGSGIDTFRVPDASLYFGSMITPVFTKIDQYDSFNFDTIFNQTYENVVNGNVFQDCVATYLQVLKEESDEKILPAFKAGMRNINAVMSSHFVIGESLIEASIMRQVAKFASELQANLIKIAEALVVQKAERYKQVVHYSLESARLYITLQDQKIKTDSVTIENDRKYGLDLYDHGAKMLSAISGGSGMGGKQRMTAAQGAIGGAMAGASIGATAGGYGAVAGAVIGGVAGALAR